MDALLYTLLTSCQWRNLPFCFLIGKRYLGSSAFRIIEIFLLNFGDPEESICMSLSAYVLENTVTLSGGKTCKQSGAWARVVKAYPTSLSALH